MNCLMGSLLGRVMAAIVVCGVMMTSGFADDAADRSAVYDEYVKAHRAAAVKLAELRQSADAETVEKDEQSELAAYQKFMKAVKSHPGLAAYQAKVDAAAEQFSEAMLADDDAAKKSAKDALIATKREQLAAARAIPELKALEDAHTRLIHDNARALMMSDPEGKVLMEKKQALHEQVYGKQ